LLLGDDHESVVFSMASYSMLIGGTVWVAIGQAVFQNILISQGRSVIPSLSISDIISTGMTGLKTLFPNQELQLIVGNGLQSVFHVGLAGACAAFAVVSVALLARVHSQKLDPVVD
jgi:hypothetical protein